MAELPVSLGTGFDPSVEFAFKQDTQNRLNSVFGGMDYAPSTPNVSMPKVNYNIDDLLTQKYKDNNDFNIVEAYFSNDQAQRDLASSIINRKIGEDAEFMSGVNIPQITPLAKGAEKYLDKELGFDPNASIAENEDYYYRNQYLSDGLVTRSLKNTGKFIGRTIGSAVLKLGQTAGYAGSVINPANWGEGFMQSVADNAFSRYMESAEEDWKNRDTWDVYHSLDYDKKGLFSKMTDATWWTDSVSDGVSFLLSAAVPGIGFGGMGARLAGNAGKLARLVTGADNIGGMGAWAFNTVSESAFEAASKFKQYKESLIEDRNNGLNTKTDAEIDREAGSMAANTFGANLAILALPNAFENAMMFQKLSKKGISPNAITASRKIEILDNFRATTNAPTTKIGRLFAADSRIPFYGKKALQATGMEGLWEENAQLAIDRINNGGNELGFTAQLFKQTRDAFSGNDTEAAESIALGGIIGTFGTGVGSKFRRNADGKFRSERRELLRANKELESLADKITQARDGWISLENIYELDTNGKVVFENGEAKIDPAKLQTKLSAMQAIASSMEQIDNVKDPDLKDFLSKDLFKEYVKSNLQAGTYDKMIKRIQDTASKPASEIESFGFDPENGLLTPQELEAKAEQFRDIYETLRNHLLEPNQTEVADDLKPVLNEVFDRQAQNAILDDYYNRLREKQLIDQGKVRTPDNASLFDIFADAYNVLSFKEEALKNQKANGKNKQYYDAKIADIRRKKAALKQEYDGILNETEVKDAPKTPSKGPAIVMPFEETPVQTETEAKEQVAPQGPSVILPASRFNPNETRDKENTSVIMPTQRVRPTSVIQPDGRSRRVRTYSLPDFAEPTSTGTGYKLTQDDFYINERQLYSPYIYDFLNTTRKMAEVENVLDENDYETNRLLDPDTQLPALDTAVENKLQNIPISANPPSTTNTTTPPETVAQRTTVTPEEVEAHKNGAPLAADVVPFIADKIAAGEPLTKEETEIQLLNSPQIEAAVEKTSVLNPPTTPVDKVPPGGVVASDVSYKGNVAYHTSLKTVSQEAEIRGLEEIANTSEYQAWSQGFITSRLSDYISRGYKYFLIKDRAEWDFNKNTANWDGNLGVVITLHDPSGNVVLLDSQYNESPTGRPMTHSADIGYTDRGDFNAKVATAFEKGMIINGKLEKPVDKDAAREIHLQINNELKNRRERVQRNEIPAQELSNIVVHSSNQVPTGKPRPAQEVFGENPTISFTRGMTTMEIENRPIPVNPIFLNENLELSNQIADLYEHTYNEKKQADEAVAFLNSVIPSSNKGFGKFTSRLVGEVGYVIEVKHAGTILESSRFRDIVRGNLPKKRVQMNVVPENIEKKITVPSINDGKYSSKKVDYYNFIKDKFTTNLKGTRTADGGITYRPLNSYFTFEFADNIGKPVPAKFRIVRNEATSTATDPVVELTPTPAQTITPTASNSPVAETPAPATTPEVTAPAASTQTTQTNTGVTSQRQRGRRRAATPQAEAPQQPTVAQNPNVTPASEPSVPQAAAQSSTPDTTPAASGPTVRGGAVARTQTPAETTPPVPETTSSETPAPPTPPRAPAINRGVTSRLSAEERSPNSIKRRTAELIREGKSYFTISDKSAKDILDVLGPEYEIKEATGLLPVPNRDPKRVKGFTIKLKKTPDPVNNPNGPLPVINENNSVESSNPDTSVSTPSSEAVAAPAATKVIPNKSTNNNIRQQYEMRLPKDVFITFYADPAVIDEIRNDEGLKKAIHKIGWANQDKVAVDRRGKTVLDLLDEAKDIQVKKSVGDSSPIESDRMAEVINRLKNSVRVLFGHEVDVVTDPAKIAEYKKNDPSLQAMGDAVILGFIGTDGKIYIDPSHADVATPIHEFGHLFNHIMKHNNREMYDRGIELMRGTSYEERVRKLYPELIENEEALLEEALATAIGEKGRALEESERKTNFLDWLRNFWNSILEGLGLNLSSEDIQDMTLEQYTDTVAASLLYGEQIAVEEILEMEVSEDDIRMPEPVRQELLDEVESLIPQIRGIYRDVFEADMEEALVTIAYQMNSSPSEMQGAINTVGERIAEISVLLHPNVGPINPEQTRFLKAETVDNAEHAQDRDSKPKKDRRGHRTVMEGIAEIAEKANIFDSLKEKTDDMIKAFARITSNPEILNDKLNKAISKNKTRIIKTLRNIEDNQGTIRGLTDTIRTSHNLLTDLQREMALLLRTPDSKEKLMAAYSFYKTGQSFKDVIKLISQVNTELAQYESVESYKKDYHAVVNLLNNTRLAYDAIEDGFIQAMRPYMAETYAKTADLYGTVEKQRDALNKQIADLRARIKSEPLRNQAKHPLNIQIAKAQEKLQRLPTKERFIKDLLGETEDMSFLGQQALSRADSGSQLVQAGQMLANRVEFENNQESLAMANEAAAQLEKLRKALGKGRTDGNWNIEEFYKPIVKQVTLTRYEDGEEKTHQQDILLNEATPEFYAERSKLDNKINDINRRLGEAELADRAKLQRQLEDAELERNRFLEDYTDTKLAPEHFEIERLLKEDLGDGSSVNRETNGIFQRLKSVASNIQDSGFEDAINQDAYESGGLNVQLEQYLNGLYAPKDSTAYKVAIRLKQAIDLRDKMGQFELTDAAKEAFDNKLSRDIRNAEEEDLSYEDFYNRIQYYSNLNSVDLVADIRATMSSIDEQQKDFNFSDNFAARQSILEDATDRNGVVVAQRVQNLAELRRLESEYKAAYDKLSPALKSQIDELKSSNIDSNTVYYTRELNKRKNELAATLVSDTVDKREAQRKAEQEIKNTDWYKENHTSDIPNAEWRMTFPLPRNLGSLKAGMNYHSYNLYNEYKNLGSEDITGRPTLKKNAKDDKYVDKEFQNLASTNPAYKEFLDWFTDFYTNRQMKYASTSRLGYLLPSMRKTSGEMLSQFARDPSGAVKTAFSDISLNEQDREANYGDRSLERIPVRLSTTIDTKDQSKDIIGSLLTYSHFANRYDRIKQIEPMLVGARDMLKGMNTNNAAVGKKGFWNGITSMYNYVKGRTAPADPNVVLREGTTESHTSQAMDILTKEVLYGNFDNELVMPVFGGTDANEFVRNLMGIASKGTFFGSVISPLKNMLGASVQQAIFANAENGAFTYQDWGQAKLDFSSNFFDFNKDFTKFGNKSLYGQVFERLKLLQGDITNEFGKRTQWNAAKYGTNWLLQFKNHAEFEIQATQAFAMLNNHKVDRNGEQISLKDAWEDDGNGGIKLKDGVTFTSDQEFAFSQRAQQMQRVLNGAYRQSERTAAERTALGKLLFYMNRYFVPMFTARFRPSYYNQQAGEDIQGFHITSAKFMRDTLVSYRGDIIKSWGDLNAQERSDVVKTSKEIGIIASLALATALLGRGDNDRRKRNTNLENYTLGLLIGTYAEARSFVFPSDYYNKISSPFFAFRPLSTAINLLDNTTSYLPALWGKDDDPNFTKDNGFWKKGDSKALADFLRLYGFTGSSSSLFLNPTGNDKAAQDYARNVETALRLRN